MEIRLFGNRISIKSRGCYYGSQPPTWIPPAVNLFVKVTNGCNAHCAFCSNAGCGGINAEFDYDKLWRIVDELRANKILVNRVNITGGEPATVPKIVNRILEQASVKGYEDIHLHLNTNGLHPASQELMRHQRWNSISMSLHHYSKDILSAIYGTKIPEDAFCFNSVNMSIVNASCNLIRGYIDNSTEVEKMLRFAISFGLPRLGFVALMKVNDYCRENYVDFDEINFETIPHLYFTESRNRGANCKCSNYLYNHNGRILEVYMRNYANPNYCESSLMYDGQYLRQGFHDDNIIY